MFPPQQTAGADSERAETGCGQHPAGSLAIRLDAIRIRYIERPDGGQQAARHLSNRGADDQRQSYSEGISQTDPRRDLGLIEADYGVPEGHEGLPDLPGRALHGSHHAQGILAINLADFLGGVAFFEQSAG
jgi:hypothetical protein